MSLPFVSPCRSSVKEGRVANCDTQKEEIFVEYLCSVFGKKWDVLISQGRRNTFSLIGSNGGCQIATIISRYSSSTEYLQPRMLKKVSEELPESLTVICKKSWKTREDQKSAEVTLLIKQHEPGLSSEIMMSWAPLLCMYRRFGCMSVWSLPQADGAPMQLVQHVLCHADHKLASSMPASSNCESIPKNGIAMTWISQSQLVWH